MADQNAWYGSLKGWAATVLGIVVFVLDYWGRATAALDIYNRVPDLAVISPYIALALFATALVFFEVRRRVSEKQALSRRKTAKKPIRWQLWSYVGFIVALAGVSAWILVRPNLTTEVLMSMFGEDRRSYPTASVTLDLLIRNAGPPTTLSDWRLTMRLGNGEVAKDILITKDIWAYRDFGIGVDPGAPQEIKKEEFIATKTAYTPIPTGGQQDGYVAFVFPGFQRDRANDPGTVFTLTFQDAREQTYTRDYSPPAKVAVRMRESSPPITEQ